MPSYSIDLLPITSGFDGNTFWAQARAGAIPGDPPTIVMTTQQTLRSGSDIFYALAEFRSNDLGETWEGPKEHTETLGRRQEPNGVEVGVCDMEPQWHAASGKLLSIGHTVRYQDDKHPMIRRRREVAYSAYNADDRTWKAWDTVDLPERPDFENAGAGSAQRVDLDDGTILLPIYHKPVTDSWNTCNSVTVLHCGFDGETLTHLDHGATLVLDEPRGFCEPSLTRCGDRYFLTLRNDVRGYVADSADGLHFAPPRPWLFDDGGELGNYNTQQHWVTRPDGLFLVYTRRGLDNDHVFRHRAPLVMAQVDTERLCIIRETEREVVPNRGARIGNFSVHDPTPDETWVVVAEWMQPVGCEEYGSDNTIWASRLRWQS